jgi:hypothetical protein
METPSAFGKYPCGFRFSMSNSHCISKIYIEFAKFPWVGVKETQRTLLLAITLGMQRWSGERKPGCLTVVFSRCVHVLCICMRMSEVEND